MKKFFVIALLLTAIGATLLMSPTQGKTKAYYSGDAVNYNGQVFVGSVNTGSFELFALENGQLVKKTNIDSPGFESKQFNDLLFTKDSGKLYVYLVNGRFIYKYDISNPEIPTVAMKIKDNSADWTSAIKMVNGKLVTITNRGVRIWNDKYQIVDSYNSIKDSNYGTASFSPNTIAVANKSTVALYSVASRAKIAEYTIAVNDERAKRAMVSDSDSTLTYVVDDKSLKAINSEGQVVKEFKHEPSDAGYDVVSSAVNPNYLYFSDGVGIVKIDKETMKSVDWAYTINTAPVGSWAMGLKVVADNSGDKVVVFNGSNIMVLDKNLDKAAVYMAVEKETRPLENLSLTIDKNYGAPGEKIALSGTGFGSNENLKIAFNGQVVSEVKADENGRFETNFPVPSVVGLIGQLTTDIKVTGVTSARTYSTSFRIR